MNIPDTPTSQEISEVLAWHTVPGLPIRYRVEPAGLEPPEHGDEFIATAVVRVARNEHGYVPPSCRLGRLAGEPLHSTWGIPVDDDDSRRERERRLQATGASHVEAMRAAAEAVETELAAIAARADERHEALIRAAGHEYWARLQTKG